MFVSFLSEQLFVGDEVLPVRISTEDGRRSDLTCPRTERRWGRGLACKPWMPCKPRMR